VDPPEAQLGGAATELLPFLAQALEHSGLLEFLPVRILDGLDLALDELAERRADLSQLFGDLDDGHGFPPGTSRTDNLLARRLSCPPPGGNRRGVRGE
jgi:hypothetical protein